jgi:hypothetical protein
MAATITEYVAIGTGYPATELMEELPVENRHNRLMSSEGPIRVGSLPLEA